MALKNQVLTRLIASRGVFLSGQTLAEEMNVTRGAIWKAVDALKADGYAVESVRNRGYSLIKSPDILRADEIVYLLLKGGQKTDVLCFDSIDSTNAEARRRAGALTRPLVILSDEQTAGRGRSGHSFFSPKRTGLYMTVALPVSLSLKAAALSTQAMAVAAVRAAAETGGPELSIKWVNDLYLSGLKVAGILTEAVSDMETGEVLDGEVTVVVRPTVDEPREIVGLDGKTYPVKPSPTKPRAPRAGLELLARAKRELGLPVVAIGGITLDNAPPLIAAGASLLAVISDVFSAPDPVARAAAYAGLFKGPSQETSA